MERAQPADIDTVLSILDEAAGWLHARGITGQWPRRFSREYIAQPMAAGDFYLAYDAGRAVGTIMLLWSDPEVWGEAPDDAGYVHSLAICRAVAGRGVGLRMLRWAEGMVAAAGRRYLRLDCWGENVDLCRYYERAGFASRGRKETPGWSCALFERDVTLTRHAP
jgi:ribosomal protein S18 acetylase RimI-like enzyme